MKHFKTLSTLFAFTVLIYSCSSEDGDNNVNQDLADEQNRQEDVAVDLTIINSDISITGATKNIGTPPQPTSNLDFQLSSSNIEAYQNSGFNIKFSSSEANIAGAYILFRDLDGNVASEYFDVPVSSFSTSKSSVTKNSKSSRFMKNGKTKNDGDYEIDIDFSDSFPPGQFCGDLCIYDSENNISQIVSVCVEVEAWGGNASLVGEWLYEGDDDDDDIDTIYCDNGGSIEYNYDNGDEIVREEILFTIESNGDFSVTDDSEYKSLDWEATQENCAITYKDENYLYNTKESGKWAYNEDNETLTLVSFKHEDFLEPQYSEDYPNGEFVFEASKVEVSSGTLILTEIYTEEGETYTEVYTFRRK